VQLRKTAAKQDIGNVQMSHERQRALYSIKLALILLTCSRYRTSSATA